MTDLMDYIMVKNIFDLDTCERYINRLNKNHWTAHQWYDNGKSEFQNHKDFTVTYDIELQKEMTESVMKYAFDYYTVHREAGGKDCQFSGIRFNKYQIGEGIRSHVDHIHSLFDGKKKGIPVVSFVGVFNDDYEGGEFMLCDNKIELKAGDCVAFPSVFLYPHEVKPVTKGSRYSWVMWSW
ncbi:MAG: 2OG-Fe(II) oxygenase [Candidatus Nanopelagicaceae bacterium]